MSDIAAVLREQAQIHEPSIPEMADILATAANEIDALRSVVRDMGVDMEEGESWLSSATLDDPTPEQVDAVRRALDSGHAIAPPEPDQNGRSVTP